MREQLIQCVELLFAGAADCEDIPQEILQNPLDRYDDLIAEGKVPEAAYRLAITGIGDVNEILGLKSQTIPFHGSAPQPVEQDNATKKIFQAVAIGLYILSLIPLMVLSEMGMVTIGFCGTLAIVAVATVLMVLGGKKGTGPQPKKAPEVLTPQQELRKSIRDLISLIGLILYFIVSFATNAWYITWILFPVTAAVQGLVKAILDLKEAVEHEE